MYRISNGLRMKIVPDDDPMIVSIGVALPGHQRAVDLAPGASSQVIYHIDGRTAAWEVTRLPADACPTCGEPTAQEMIDVGPGEIPCGPRSCPSCHWIENDPFEGCL